MRQSIIYSRVSSERQANEGGGIQSQEQRCRSYAQNCGYEVIRTFSDEGISGAVIDRPGIQALLAFLQEQGGEIVVIIDDISRIARDVVAHVSLRAAIRAAGGKLESPSFTFGESAAEELVENIMAATAQYGRKGNREQVLNRQKARLQLGYWTFHAPLGYHYEKHPVHKKIMVPSRKAKQILARALEGFSVGRLETNRELVLYLQQQGFFRDVGKMSLTVLEKRATRILNALPLYAGFVEYPKWGLERVPGKHKAIISLATLGRLEERLGCTSRAVAAPRVDATPRLILRHFIRCAECGRPLTGSLAHGKYARYLCYYKEGCSRYGHSFSAEKTEKAFEHLLASLTPDEKFMQLVEEMAHKMWKARLEEWDLEHNHFQKKLEVDRQEISGLVRRLGKIHEEVADEVEHEILALKQEVATLEARMARYEEGLPDFDRAWTIVGTLFRDPYGYWKRGSETQKRTIHRMVFAVPPTYDKNQGFCTYDLSLPYQLSRSFAESNVRLVELTGESWHLDSIPFEWFDTILQWDAMLGN